MTARSLPPHANLRHLQHEAKSIHRAHQQRKTEVCAILRLLPRLSGCDDEAILSATVPLQEAQHALALSYGFDNWASLKRRVVTTACKETVDATDRDNSRRKYLGEAVDMIQRLVNKEKPAGRNHLVHVLFAMRAAGWSIDCETLMCATGAAFSFRYQHDNFHVAYLLPKDWEKRVAEATGFLYQYLDHSSAEDAWNHIVASVNSGRLVNSEWMEGVTFAGYEDADCVTARMVFAVDPVFQWPGDWWHWEKFAKWYDEWPKRFRWLARHGGRSATPTPRESAIAVLRKIPYWAEEERHSGRWPQAHWGLDGIRAYAEDIADMSKPDDYMIAPWKACHAIHHQWQARRFPGVYLRRAAMEFPKQIGEYLADSADNYDAAYKAWQRWYSILGENPQIRSERGSKAAAEAKNSAWTCPASRMAGADAVFQALRAEKEAVGLVTRALAAIDKGTGSDAGKHERV